MKTICVLDDGETWSEVGYRVKLTDEQFKRICEGEHPRWVVPEKLWAQEAVLHTVVAEVQQEIEPGAHVTIWKDEYQIVVEGNVPTNYARSK